MNSKRIASLDYLRGLMALSVMIYHYTVWSGVGLASDSFLSKLCIYAVAMFYILSGLSLTIVYKGRINSTTDITQFFIKRIFRIAPLFWLSVFAVLMLGYVESLMNHTEFQVDHSRLLLNFTLLFGFVDPTAYLSTGAWSIGNEVVFYAVFPILFLLSTRHRWVTPSVLIISVVVGGVFSIFWLNAFRSLVDQWSIYINPFNQIFLFMGGVYIGLYAKPTSRRVAAGVAVAALVIFSLFSVDGDRINLVSGIGRVVLSLCCFAFVWATYVARLELQGLVSRGLQFFGEGCYSIYLLHPLVSVPIVFIAERIGLGLFSAYSIAAAVTLMASWLTFRFIEKPMIQLGSNVSKSLQSRQGLPA